MALNENISYKSQAVIIINKKPKYSKKDQKYKQNIRSKVSAFYFLICFYLLLSYLLLSQLISNMKSLANDIRILQTKQEESSQDLKGTGVQSQRKLQQLIQSNHQCEQAIKALEKQADKLQTLNKDLDQQIRNKKEELEKAKQQIQQQEEKQEEQAQEEMSNWISHVQNYSGVPQDVVDSLICLQYQGSNEEEICLSCYQPMQIGAQCKYLPCCHLFHSECINNHLKTNRLCPACGESVIQ